MMRPLTVSNVLNETYQFWTERMSVGEEENSRISGPPVTLNKDLMLQLNIIMNRYVAKAERLIGNFTSKNSKCYSD